MSRIGIDARFFGPENKGLGRYTQKLVEELEIIADNESEYFVFLRRANFDCYQPKRENFKKVLADFPWYSFYEQLIFPFLLLKYRLDLVHFCHFNVPFLYPKNFIVTIHDLILIHYPTFKNTTRMKAVYFFKLLAYRLVIFLAVKRANKIITVSQYTKNDLMTKLGAREQQIGVIYEGATLNGRPIINNGAKVLKKYGISKPFILYAGNAYPHKNLSRLCDAFQIVQKNQPELSLVLVGGEDYFYRQIKAEVKERAIEKIIFPGFVSDDELKVLYRETALFVFPSLYEGFGLPPLEALFYGSKVISSNRTSMPEILGELADYFNPEDVTDLAKKIVSGFLLPIPNQKAIREKANLFNWRKMAEATLEVYRQLI